MYESPIEKIYGEIQSQIIKQYDENIMYAVKQAIGCSVDKNELIKALKYDREQYEKGYRDGLNADKWIPVSERLPEEGEEVLVSAYDTYGKKVIIARYQGEKYGFTCGLVSAWMPLPKAYKTESEGE